MGGSLRVIIGMGIVLLAAVTGYLALVAAGPALAINGGTPLPAGQVRGLAFTVVMALVTVCLLGLAAYVFGWVRSRSQPGQ